MELSLDNIGEIDAMADAETPAALARTESGVRRIAPSAQLPLSASLRVAFAHCDADAACPRHNSHSDLDSPDAHRGDDDELRPGVVCQPPGGGGEANRNRVAGEAPAARALSAWAAADQRQPERAHPAGLHDIARHCQ